MHSTDDDDKVLNSAEFAGSPGGASRRMTDLTRGPKSGYYVSRDGGRPVVSGGSLEWTSNPTDSQAKKVRTSQNHLNLSRAASLAATPDDLKSEVYQGRWEDPDSGYTFHDVSDRTTNVGEALAKGAENLQRGVYAARADRTISVMDYADSGEPLGVNLKARNQMRYLLRPGAHTSDDDS